MRTALIVGVVLTYCVFVWASQDDIVDLDNIVWDNNDRLLDIVPPTPSIMDIGNCTWELDNFEAKISYDPNSNTITLTGFTVEEALKRFFYYISNFYDPNEYLMSAKIIAPSKYCECTGSRMTISCLVYGCDCTTCGECGKKIKQ